MKLVDRSPRTWFHIGQGLLIGIGVVGIGACGGGGGGSGSGSSQFRIDEVSNGFGRLLPYEIAVRDASGNPTNRVIEITNYSELAQNLTAANPIRPPTQWPTAAVLPNQQPGNHFIYVRFTQPIDIDSVLDNVPGSAENLRGAIKVSHFIPGASGLTDIKGRGFVGGKSYGPDVGTDGRLVLTTWVTRDPTDPTNTNLPLHAAIPQAVGFPGTESSFAGDDILLDPNTFVFVVDQAEDGLANHETFPSDTNGSQIQIRINEDVLSTSGRHIVEVGFTSSTVGPDRVSPEISGIIPGPSAENVDPETNIELQFTEPLQLLSFATLDTGRPPALSSAMAIEFGPDAQRVRVPFFIRPFSIFDFSRIEVVPAYNFPGSGPEVEGTTCGTFGIVQIETFINQFRDLTGVRNQGTKDQTFTTREGTGIVNAPVTPDAIYVGRGGATPGLSVIDLNGFGGSTGNPTYDPARPIKEGNTNYPNNPNVGVNGANLVPPLQPGTCTINGGSEGVFTLTKDSSLNDLLARAPLLDSVGDMVIGHALDLTFNNAAPFGCQAGGGNICAATGLKQTLLQSGGANSLAPSTTAAFPLKTINGGENLVSWAPCPNPPPILFPPLCLSPLILSQEPTAPGLLNLLVPGTNSRGNPGLNSPPTSMLTKQQNSFFVGPTPPQPLVSFCGLYSMRQQVGHFLYVVDRVAGEIVVLNSNRMTVIDRIATPDPTSLAMSPNVDLLAVTNENADQVSFIDTDPASSSFHQVVRTVRVGVGPTGIAWETGNEDIFVCNQGDGSVTLISAFSLRPRKTLRNQITRPIDVALTPRQIFFGFQRGVYYAYILNQDGNCAVFESGPDGINGWGFDDTVGSLPFNFFRPKAIQPDVQRLNSAVWIVHEKPLDANGLPTGATGGAISVVGISSGIRGIIPITTSSLIPSFRDLGFSVQGSIGEGPNGLSGVPVDIAFDNMVNTTALNNYNTNFSAGQPLSINGKSLVRGSGVFTTPSSAPAFMFLAVPNPGVVDVLELDTGTLQRIDANVFRPGIQSIPAPNVTSVVDYLRQ
jgi:hypothetical protein